MTTFEMRSHLSSPVTGSYPLNPKPHALWTASAKNFYIVAQDQPQKSETKIFSNLNTKIMVETLKQTVQQHCITYPKAKRNSTGSALQWVPSSFWRTSWCNRSHPRSPVMTMERRAHSRRRWLSWAPPVPACSLLHAKTTSQQYFHTLPKRNFWRRLVHSKEI